MNAPHFIANINLFVFITDLAVNNKIPYNPYSVYFQISTYAYTELSFGYLVFLISNLLGIALLNKSLTFTILPEEK